MAKPWAQLISQLANVTEHTLRISELTIIQYCEYSQWTHWSQWLDLTNHAFTLMLSVIYTVINQSNKQSTGGLVVLTCWPITAKEEHTDHHRQWCSHSYNCCRRSRGVSRFYSSCQRIWHSCQSNHDPFLFHTGLLNPGCTVACYRIPCIHHHSADSSISQLSLYCRLVWRMYSK